MSPSWERGHPGRHWAGETPALPESIMLAIFLRKGVIPNE